MEEEEDIVRSSSLCKQERKRGWLLSTTTGRRGRIGGGSCLRLRRAGLEWAGVSKSFLICARMAG